MNPKVSIIIPVYNTAKYLPQCLDSLINQTLTDIEIICIDDGSTDESPQILAQYARKDSRIKIITQKNQGAAVARNKGISEAKGTFLQFLDSDDCYTLDISEKLYNALIRNDADLAICNANILNEETGKISNSDNWPIQFSEAPIQEVFSWQEYTDKIFTLFHCNPWNKMWKSEIIKKNKIQFQNLSSCNDFSFDFIARLCTNKIIIIDETLVTYRANRANSISHYRWNKSINCIKALVFLKKYLLKNKIFNRLEKTYNSLVQRSLCYEMSNTTQEQHSKFITELKFLFPDEFEYFHKMLPSTNIIEKIDNLSKEKKIMLWGASLYLNKIFMANPQMNPNILGVIDINPEKWGTNCGGYKIYPPQKILELKPDGIILTIYNNNDYIYNELKKELNTNYKNVELLPNIF